MNSLRVLARLFWEICLFRRGPQDVPSSNALMWSLLVAYALAGLIILSFEFPLESALPATCADAAFLVVSTGALLQLFQRSPRTRQTVTALAGCGVIVSLFALPIVIWLSYAPPANLDVSLAKLLWLSLFAWSVFVSARIYQQALIVNLITGLAVALTLVILNQQFIDLFLPAATGG